MEYYRIVCLALAVLMLAGCGARETEAPLPQPPAEQKAPEPVITPPAEPVPEPAPAPEPAPQPEPEPETWPVRGVERLELEQYLWGQLLRLDETGLPVADESTLAKRFEVRYFDKKGAETDSWTQEGSLEIALTLWDSGHTEPVRAALEQALTAGELVLPVAGLGSRVTGVPQGDALYREANAILEAGIDYRWELNRQSWTRASQEAFWQLVDQQGLAFAESIRDHVLHTYLTDAAAAWLAPDLTARRIEEDPALAWAFTLRVWGYGEGLLENGALAGFVDPYGNRYTLAGEDHPGAREFFDLMMRRYGGDIRLLEDSEGVGTPLERAVLDAYVVRFGTAAPVEGISGLGAEGDTVTLTLLQPEDGALAALCIPVENTPGPYTLLEQGADYALLDSENGKLELRVCADLTAALLEGAVTEGRIAAPDRASLEALEAAGYTWTGLEAHSLGWAGISPEQYPNRKARLALGALMDPALAASYWPAGTAEAAGWPVCGWLARGETVPVFDSEAARQRFLEAGYSFSENRMTDPEGKQAVFVFSLPALQHPAKAVFDRAAELLTGWGAEARVEVQPDLVALVRRGEAGIWALAWDCSGDPRYLAERYDPNGHTAAAHALGLHLLADTDAGEDLAELVTAASRQLLPEERAQTWQEAFAQLQDLAVQVPLYRRGAVWVSK